MLRSTFLVYMPHPPGNNLLMLRPPRLQIVMMKFLFFHPTLLWFGVIVMMWFLFRALCLLGPPPFGCPRPTPQACGSG
jgi:hypothetical protein